MVKFGFYLSYCLSLVKPLVCFCCSTWPGMLSVRLGEQNLAVTHGTEQKLDVLRIHIVSLLVFKIVIVEAIVEKNVCWKSVY